MWKFEKNEKKQTENLKTNIQANLQRFSATGGAVRSAFLNLACFFHHIPVIQTFFSLFLVNYMLVCSRLLNIDMLEARMYVRQLLLYIFFIRFLCFPLKPFRSYHLFTVHLKKHSHQLTTCNIILRVLIRACVWICVLVLQKVNAFCAIFLSLLL